MDDLLKLAVTHELGHALSNEKNERKADAYGEQLRRRIAVVCKSGNALR
jgi:Zn-dependent peptidase ImmA (M78 family)